MAEGNILSWIEHICFDSQRSVQIFAFTSLLSFQLHVQLYAYMWKINLDY